MIAVLTQKLKAHTIEEGQQQQQQQQQSFKVTHGWKDGEDSEDENQELVQIDRERRHQATSVVPVLPTSGRVRAGSRAATASTGHDRPSSEEELESIIVARDCGLPGEKRKWCQVTGGGRMAPCGCGERASSSDEEVRDLCCSKAFRPIQQNGQDCGSPVLFGASPPRCLQPTARCPRGRFPCPAFEHASPCKRHKHIFADGGRRPSLDFEKMQQRMLLKKTSVPRTRVVKIRVTILNQSSRNFTTWYSL
uniref:Si:dkey-16j16.4 n=1 Tax=Eptatretus burgeri TaxID=7764 RepID=A0A8C4Q8F0_EPTBU